MHTARFVKLAMSFVLLFSALEAIAGVDISGPVQAVQVAPDGTLWFAMDTTPASTYCISGWMGLTMYVPNDHPQYPYYFAMLVAAASKNKNVYVGNISIYNGSSSCDITKTGYGLVFLQ